MAKIKKWTPVIVGWMDATTVHEESHSDEEFPAAPRRSAGFFLKRNKEGVTIAMEDDRGMDDDHDCQVVTTIPTGMVLSLTVLQDRELIPMRRVRKKKEAPVVIPENPEA